MMVQEGMPPQQHHTNDGAPRAVGPLEAVRAKHRVPAPRHSRDPATVTLLPHDPQAARWLEPPPPPEENAHQPRRGRWRRQRSRSQHSASKGPNDRNDSAFGSEMEHRDHPSYEHPRVYPPRPVVQREQTNHAAGGSRELNLSSGPPMLGNGPKHSNNTNSVGADDVIPHVLQPPAALHILWDFENLWPRKRLQEDYGLSNKNPTLDFFLSLKAHLNHLYGTGLQLTELRAYLGNRDGMGIDVDELNDLQFKVRLAGSKREAADRALVGDALDLMEHPDRQHFVIVSSDKDFGETVKRLRARGHHVTVVHDAKHGSLHESVLQVHAQQLIAVRDFLA